MRLPAPRQHTRALYGMLHLHLHVSALPWNIQGGSVVSAERLALVKHALLQAG